MTYHKILLDKLVNGFGFGSGMAIAFRVFSHDNKKSITKVKK